MSSTSVNVSSNDVGSYELSDTLRWPFVVLGAISWTNGVFGNIYVLTALSRRPALRSPHNIFIGHLAVADLFVVGYGQLFWVLDVATDTHMTVNATHCAINGYIGFTCCVAGIIFLWTISCNRFISICHHSTYRKLRVTKWRASWFCVAVWVISFAACSIPFYGPGEYGHEQESRSCFLIRTDSGSYVYITITIPVTAVLVSIAYFNLAIFRFWRQSKKRICQWKSTGSGAPSNQRPHNADGNHGRNTIKTKMDDVSSSGSDENEAETSNAVNSRFDNTDNKAFVPKTARKLSIGPIGDVRGRSDTIVPPAVVGERGDQMVIQSPAISSQKAQEPNLVAQKHSQLVQESIQLVQKPNQLPQEPIQLVEKPYQLIQNPNQLVQKPDLVVQKPDQLGQKPHLVEQKHNQLEEEADNVAAASSGGMSVSDELILRPLSQTSNPAQLVSSAWVETAATGARGRNGGVSPDQPQMTETQPPALSKTETEAWVSSSSQLTENSPVKGISSSQLSAATPIVDNPELGGSAMSLGEISSLSKETPILNITLTTSKTGMVSQTSRLTVPCTTKQLAAISFTTTATTFSSSSTTSSSTTTATTATPSTSTTAGLSQTTPKVSSSSVGRRHAAHHHHHRSASDRGLVRSLLGVYVCLVILYGTSVVIGALMALTVLPRAVLLLASLLFFLNGSVNWLLYVAFNKNFRLHWRDVCCCAHKLRRPRAGRVGPEK